MPRTTQPDDDVWLGVEGNSPPGIVVGVDGEMVSVLWPTTSPLMVTRHHITEIERVEPFRCDA